MKKTILILAILVSALSWLFPRYLGFSLWQLGNALDVATGLGAKLACSGHYITGLDKAQAKQDVVSYSAAAALLDLQFDEQQKSVTASMFGLYDKSAQFRPGLGCTLEVGDTQLLNQVTVASILPDTLMHTPWPLGNGPAALHENTQQTAQRILMADNEAGLQTRAILVVKDNQIIAESYAQGFDQDTPFMGWSMGKSVTAMLLGRLQSVQPYDDKQTQLFAQWSQDPRQHISLENLLQMSSGLDFDETYAPGSDATRMLFTEHSASDVALSSEAMHKPGEHNSYSSGTTNILARWLFEQSGAQPQALYDFMYGQLFNKLNMSEFYFEPDGKGVPVGSSYIYATARDWARLAQLMVNKGQWQGQQLISADWVHRASQPNSSDNEKAYGYQFWLNQGDETLRWPNIPVDAYAMQGNRSQRVMMIPSKNMVIVRLGWTQGDYPLDANFSELMHSYF